MKTNEEIICGITRWNPLWITKIIIYLSITKQSFFRIEINHYFEQAQKEVHFNYENNH